MANLEHQPPALPSRTFVDARGPSLESLEAQSGDKVPFLEQSFQEALDLVRFYPQDAGAHIALGNEYWARGARDSALLALKEATEIEPASLAAHQSYAEACLWMARFGDRAREGFLDEAADSFRTITDLDSSNVTAHYKLGVVRYMFGIWDSAQRCFERAIELMPNHVWAHVELAKTLLMRNRPGEAEQRLQTAIALAPHSGEARFQLGRVLMQLGRFDEAATQLCVALHHDPGHMEAEDLRYRALQALGDARHAEQIRLDKQERITQLPLDLRPLVHSAIKKNELKNFSYANDAFALERIVTSGSDRYELALTINKDGSGCFGIRDPASGCEIGFSMEWKPGMKAGALQYAKVIEAFCGGNISAAVTCLRRTQLLGVCVSSPDNCYRLRSTTLRRFYWALKTPTWPVGWLKWNVERFLDWLRRR